MNIWEVLIVFCIVLCAVGTFIVGRGVFIGVTRRNMRRRTVPVQGYCQEKEIRIAMSLVDEAEGGIEILDKGDFVEGSIYNDESFLKAVAKRINEEPDFEVRCFFDVGDERLAFIRKFRCCPQVKIFVRKDKRWSESHYKIASTSKGIKAYIYKDGTVTSPGETCDELSFYDMPRPDTRLASKLLFESLRQPVEVFNRIGGDVTHVS